MSQIKNYSFSKFPLYANETPIFRKQPNMVYVPYGKNNDYSDYLAYLYNNSGIHGAIIKGKATYIFGKGFKIRADWNGDKVALQKTLNSINSSQTADELARKKIFERTLYGGCAYLIEWDVFGGIKSVKLQPFNTIRTNVDKSEFYISKEWTREQSVSYRWKRSNGRLPEDAVTLPAFNPLKKEGKQILYLIDDNPASDIYPLPEYNSGATPIETDIECNFFQLNNVKTGFSAGTMVTFFNGTAINDEEQSEIEHAFKSKTTGSDNAGEILLNFQNPNTTPPEISPLRSNELDKQYEQLSKDTINKILYSHRVSNGLLFGIKTPGELGGGRSEFDLSWEHFSNTYVKPKQQEEEEDMNYILSLYGFIGNPVELTSLDPIGMELTSDIISRTVDADSFADMVYQRLGIEKPKLVKKDDILTIINSNPIVAPKILESLTVNEIRSIINLPAIVGGDTLKTSAFSSEEDFILAKFLEIGEPAENYEIVKECFIYSDSDNFAVEDDEKLIEAIKKGKTIKVSDLAKKLGMSESEVYKSLERLNKANILQVKYTEVKGEISITPEEIQEPPTQEVGLETKWRYTTNLEPKLLSTSRKFCVDLIEADLLYSRAQIDNMRNVASTKGYNDDVFKYKGGWQTIEGTVTHIPSCRHFWQSVLVSKKKSNFEINFYDPSQERNEDGTWGDGGGSGGGSSEDYNPNDKSIIAVDKDPVGTWKPSVKNNEDLHKQTQKKLNDLGIEYSANEAHTVWDDGSKHSSYYIEVKDKDEPLKTIAKIRISEHQTGSARKSNEINVDKTTVGNALLQIEQNQYPNRFKEKVVKQKVTKVVEVPKEHSPKALKGGNYDPKTDKIISTRVSAKGSEILKVERNEVKENKILVRKK